MSGVYGCDGSREGTAHCAAKRPLCGKNGGGRASALRIFFGRGETKTFALRGGCLLTRGSPDEASAFLFCVRRGAGASALRELQRRFYVRDAGGDLCGCMLLLHCAPEAGASGAGEARAFVLGTFRRLSAAGVHCGLFAQGRRARCDRGGPPCGGPLNGIRHIEKSACARKRWLPVSASMKAFAGWFSRSMFDVGGFMRLRAPLAALRRRRNPNGSLAPAFSRSAEKQRMMQTEAGAYLSERL